MSSRVAGRRRWLAVSINLAAAFAGLLAFDVWRRNQPAPGNDAHLEGTVTGFFSERADDLGYVLRPDQRFTARLVASGQVIYDVVYTTGPDRFRITPHAAVPPHACVLLFGDSNTFGVGVDDWETYAWRLGARSGVQAERRIAVHNFGIPGYGPHQMLAGLQSGRYERALSCVPTDAIFFFIPDSVWRVAGRSQWDGHGPRFRLDSAGRAVRDGNFDPGVPPKVSAADLHEGVLSWRRLLGVRRTGTPAETELTAAVIVESAREVRRIAPGSAFHVLFWNIYDDERLDSIVRSLTAAGVVVHSVDAIIPGHRKDWRKYVLSSLDSHPNPDAHRRIAEYIAREILPALP